MTLGGWAPGSRLRAALPEAFQADGVGLRTRTPLALWLALAVVPTVVWFALPEKADVDPGFDWAIYARAFELWMTTGSPYEVVPANWDPCRAFPYIYPPTSWPLMVIAAVAPWQVVGLGLIPLALVPPRLILLPVAVPLLLFGAGPALYLGNVNAMVAGLLVLAFLPGRWGGIALAAAVALKGYPLVLLPFLWRDRARLRWFVGVLAVLAVSGTVMFGLGSWVDLGRTLLGQGPHCDIGLNPLAPLGLLRVLPAAAVVLAGLALHSPTVTLTGATLATGVVTRHYLVTLAATLPFEPVADHAKAPVDGRRRPGLPGANPRGDKS